MRHRSIVLDSNDSDLVQLRLAFAKKGKNLEDVDSKPGSADRSGCASPIPSLASNLLNTEADATARLDDVQRAQMAAMKAHDLVEMLVDTTQLEEQVSILHCLWMKCGGDFPVTINNRQVSIRALMEEIYSKLFVEMFRLRIGLIIQVLASELARLKDLSASDALQNLLTISPFELKSMLLMLLSGRLLEEVPLDDEAAAKETRTGIGSFRKHIEERKSLRKSMRHSRRDAPPTPKEVDEMEADLLEEEAGIDDFQFGIWLRHRRIDGALNRVPNHFYASLWDSVHRFHHGLQINGIILHWGLTQEMTRREIKFALEVEEVLNQISEPEYREMVIETLWLLGRVDRVLRNDSLNLPQDRPLDIDNIIARANRIFVDHNRELDTIVVDCCAGGKSCGGARNLCIHFLDSAPAGEYGTSHYIIRAFAALFT
ncbi:unnamed protein product, partial [Mesorhabditis spiculigera]